MRPALLLFLIFLVGTLGRADTMNTAPGPYTLCGIGAVLREDNGSPIVTEVLPKSPALSAGLAEGDKIVQVDGLKVAGMTLEEVVELIRGPQDTVVKISVTRGGEPSPLSFTMTRDVIQLNAK